MRPRRRLQHPGRESRHRRMTDETLLRLLSRYDSKGALKLMRLWRGWEAVVGEEIALLARPLGHKDSTLVLHAQDSVAAQELSYYAPELIARANAFLGEEVFDKVRFELLDGRVPLAVNGRPEENARPEGAPGPRPPEALGGLVGRLDPDSPVGRCYLAYVRRFAARAAAGQDENTRPERASKE